MTIESTPQFKEDVKYYIKKKNYFKINDDLKPAIDELEKGNLVGDKISGLNIPVDASVYKVRIANSSAGLGKSNGFRLLYYVKIGDEIFLLTIYSKKDDSRIPTKKQIQDIIDKLIS